MQLKELKNKEIFPNISLEELPKNCPYCKEPLEITITFSKYYCKNPYCVGKIAYSIEKLFQELGIKKVNIEQMIKINGLKTTYDLLKYHPNKQPSLDGNLTKTESEEIYRRINYFREMNLVDYLRRSYIKTISKYADIFKGETIESIYENLEKEGLAYIQKKLNLGDTDISPVAINIMQELITYEEDIKSALPYIKLVKDKEEIGVYFVEEPDNKDFLLELNNREPNKYYYKTSRKDAPYIFMNKIRNYAILKMLEGVVITNSKINQKGVKKKYDKIFNNNKM